MKTEDIILFHRIVESSSVSIAADLLNLPKSTVSRRLLTLEEELNTKLFHRQNRAINLTTSGAMFYERSLRIIADIENVVGDMNDDQADVVGHLRILMFPLPHLVPLVNLLFKFMDLNPKITVEFVISSERTDMIKQNIDVAFTIEDTFAEEDMVARLLQVEDLCFFASETYFQRHGRPQNLAEISQHNSIIFRFPNGKKFNEVPLCDEKTVAVSGNLWVNNVYLAKEAARQGRGIAYLPVSMCQDDVEKGTLIPIFPELKPYQGKYFLVYPSRRFISSASRRFIDFMMAEMTEDGKPKDLYLAKHNSDSWLL